MINYENMIEHDEDKCAMLRDSWNLNHEGLDLDYCEYEPNGNCDSGFS